MAVKWGQNLIPNSPNADSGVHDSVRHHVSNSDCHGFMSVLKSYSRDWNVRKVYPENEHQSGLVCRNNIPIYDKVSRKRLGYI